MTTPTLSVENLSERLMHVHVGLSASESDVLAKTAVQWFHDTGWVRVSGAPSPLAGLHAFATRLSAALPPQAVASEPEKTDDDSLVAALLPTPMPAALAADLLRSITGTLYDHGYEEPVLRVESSGDWEPALIIECGSHRDNKEGKA